MRWNRSAAEIRFRLHQESANFLHYLSPPKPRGGSILKPEVPFPAGVAVAESLRGSFAAEEILRIARQIIAGTYPLLGFAAIKPGRPPQWGKDWLHGQQYPRRASRRTPYLNFEAVGDHKIIWELSRHQHLVLLAQAYLLSGDSRFIEELVQQWLDWHQHNPMGQGIHWTSALEVGFRVLSWCWLAHWVGEQLPVEKLQESVHQHGCYLERNLSHYFSPNTHLLGEALALQAIGRFFPGLPRAGHWLRLGESTFAREIHRQTRPDGGYFEQSDYYHVYALDMLALHYLLADRPAALLPLLGRMADFLAAVSGPEGRLPGFGDDDGGRLFHPYGERRNFARGTLAVCARLLDQQRYLLDPADQASIAAWWLGPGTPGGEPPNPRGEDSFPDTGLHILTTGEFRLIADAGPFGPYQSGHSHSDTLSFVARLRGQDILVDPGTYTYMESPVERNAFRGAAAHNTISIQNRDQADPHNAFGWRNPPVVRLLARAPGYMAALCLQREYQHRREWSLAPGRLTIVDSIEGPPGPIQVTQYWQPAGEVRQIDATRFELAAGVSLQLDRPAELEDFWFSPAYGVRQPATRIACRGQGQGPLTFLTILEWS